MTLVEGDEMQSLWGLVADLSAQLSSNRELCERLQAQAEMLKGQAHHNTTGFSLRRFNVDISREKFESTLEKTNAQLVLENQSLAHENKQLSSLLREYEVTLETVMRKFRSFSHATQSHTLALTSHYDTLLSSTAHAAASADLHSSTELSSTLAHLGSLVRLAIRAVDGEVPLEDDDDISEAGAVQTDPFALEGYRVGSPSGVEPSQRKLTKARAYGSSAGADSRWAGTGGYTGLAGDIEAERSELALERLTEEERLRCENEALRQLLEIKEENERKVMEAVAAAAAGHPLPEPPSHRPSLVSSRSGSIGALGLASSSPGQYGMPTVSLPKSGALLNRYPSPVSPTAPASLVPSSPPKPPAVSLAAVMNEPIATVDHAGEGHDNESRDSNGRFSNNGWGTLSAGRPSSSTAISLDDDDDEDEEHLPPRNSVSMGVPMKRSDSVGQHHMLRPPNGGDGTPMDVGALGDEDEFEAVPDDDDEQDEELPLGNHFSEEDALSGEVLVTRLDDGPFDLGELDAEEDDSVVPREDIVPSVDDEDAEDSPAAAVLDETPAALVSDASTLSDTLSDTSLHVADSTPTPASTAEGLDAQSDEERDITSAAQGSPVADTGATVELPSYDNVPAHSVPPAEEESAPPEDATEEKMSAMLASGAGGAVKDGEGGAMVNAEVVERE